MSKRTELMIAEDKSKVAELLARGYRNRAEMARVINQGRAEQFHISAQQVGHDIKAVETAYMEKAFENIEIYRHKAMDELLYLLKMYYEGYEKSRISKVTIESQRAIDNAQDYDDIMNQPEMEQEFLEGVHPFGRDGKVKEEYRGEGNPAFLNGAKGVLDSLNKIRSVDGASKLSLTDPTGTEEATGVAEFMKQRMAELAERSAPTDTDKFLLEPMPEEEKPYGEDEE